MSLDRCGPDSDEPGSDGPGVRPGFKWCPGEVASGVRQVRGRPRGKARLQTGPRGAGVNKSEACGRRFSASLSLSDCRPGAAAERTPYVARQVRLACMPSSRL